MNFIFQVILILLGIAILCSLITLFILKPLILVGLILFGIIVGIYSAFKLNH